MRKLLNSKRVQDLSAIVTILVAVPTFAGWLISLFDVSRSTFLTGIVSYLPVLFNLSVVLSLIFISTTLWRWHRRFTISFTDNFKHQLNDNWEYEGDWKIIEQGVLSVRNSGIGGITNVGSHWENYDFEFETRIVNECSSWVIRAQDLNNYFMFQCRRDVIRPHQRVTVPKIQTNPAEPTTSPAHLVVAFEVGWKIWDGRPHNSNLDDWTKVRIRVRGSDVMIWIAERLVFHEPTLVPYATGRVGFRNYGAEEAHFRNVKVRPIE
jgi:hypothetical protein